MVLYGITMKAILVYSCSEHPLVGWCAFPWLSSASTSSGNHISTGRIIVVCVVNGSLTAF